MEKDASVLAEQGGYQWARMELGGVDKVRRDWRLVSQLLDATVCKYIGFSP